MSLLTNFMGRCNLIDECGAGVPQPQSIPIPFSKSGLFVEGQNPRIRAQEARERSRQNRRFTCSGSCCAVAEQPIDPIDFSLFQIRCTVEKLKYEEGIHPLQSKPVKRLPHYIPQEREMTPTEETLLSKTRYYFLHSLRQEEKELRKHIRDISRKPYP